MSLAPDVAAPIEALLPLLETKLNSTRTPTTQVKVFGDEVPGSRISELPNAPTVVVSHSGGWERRGTLGFYRFRVDVACYAGSYALANRLADQVRRVLEALKPADGYRSVRREAGPFRAQDETRRWPTIWASYIVMMTVAN